MSENVLVDFVGPSHWTYMSSVLAEALEETVKTRKRVSIPPAVLDDAVEFLHLALQAEEQIVPRNPAGTAESYLIAADALEASVGEPVSEVTSHLQSYRELLGSLTARAPITDDQFALAIKMIAFFRRVREAGAAEAYDRVIQSDSTVRGLQAR